MARLGNRIDNALNEARMLLLGGQVFLGFSYRICFEPNFDKISYPGRLAEVAALGLMTAGLGWLIWPAAYHQIAEDGRLTPTVDSFTTTVLDWALLPFSIGLGLSLYPVCIALGTPHALLISILGFSFALLAWYAWGLSQRGPQRRTRVKEKDRFEKQESEQQGKPDLSDRIKKVLIECRMALPGAQAFLGFQFAIVFTQSFSELPYPYRLIHLFSLLATTVSIVLLIAPAAYHRLAEAGEDTERFHTVAGRLLLTSLIFLGPGMSGDLLIVLKSVTGSATLAYSVAGALLLLFYALWFGASLLKRIRK